MEVVLFDVGLVDGEGAAETWTSLRRTQSVPPDHLLLWSVEGKLVSDGDLLLKQTGSKPLTFTINVNKSQKSIRTGGLKFFDPDP